MMTSTPMMTEDEKKRALIEELIQTEPLIVVRQSVYNEDLCNVENLATSFNNIRVLLDKVEAAHPNFSDFEIETDWDYDSTRLYVFASRLENEAEYARRIRNMASRKIAAEKRAATKASAAEKQRQADLAEFERLKKKLEL